MFKKKIIIISIAIFIVSLSICYCYKYQNDLLRRYAFKDLGITSLHNEGYTGKGVVIAILDSGVQPNNDIKNNIIKFVDFVNDRKYPYDDFGHGTEISGLIVGNGKNSLGIYKGIAPATELISCKVLDENGQTSIMTLENSLQWVIDNREKYNIKIVCISIGFEKSESDQVESLKEIINKTIDSGIIVVSSSGNNGYGENTMTSPAILENVISVGSVDIVKTNLKRVSYKISKFSSIEKNKAPVVYAPGESVITTIASSNRFSNYKSVSGTSYSSAIICGKISLLLEKDNTYDLSKIKEILINEDLAIY